MSGRLHDVVGRPLGGLVAQGWNAISDQKINPNLNLFTWSGNTAIDQVTVTILTVVALFAASAALGKVTVAHWVVEGRLRGRKAREVLSNLLKWPLKLNMPKCSVAGLDLVVPPGRR